MEYRNFTRFTKTITLPDTNTGYYEFTKLYLMYKDSIWNFSRLTNTGYNTLYQTSPDKNHLLYKY